MIKSSQIMPSPIVTSYKMRMTFSKQCICEGPIHLDEPEFATIFLCSVCNKALHRETNVETIAESRVFCSDNRNDSTK